MIPDQFHDFFLGAVTVGGALVGLLFVAISVRPGGVAIEGEAISRIRAIAALSALLDALFVSLIALLPSSHALGPSAIGLGASGLLSMLTLLAIAVAGHRQLAWFQSVRMVMLGLGQGATFVLQIVNGVNLRSHHNSISDVNTQAVLVIVLFAFGVARAWEYVGGQKTGVWGVFAETRRAVHPVSVTEKQADG
jgi:hypothetical protein